MKRNRLIAIGIALLVNLFAGLLYWGWRDNYEYAMPEAFWGLLLIPLLSIFYVLRFDQSKAVIRTSVSDQLPKQKWSPFLFLRHLPFVLRSIAIVAFITVIARPQSKSSYENMTKEGIDIVMAMDLSASMLSRDFKPNRLESSKEVALDFVKDRPDDRIGVVIYEGESFTQVPLTSDHKVVNDAIRELNTGRLEGGTAIGMGLATSVSRLKDSNAKSKVVILLTDGVNNSGQVKPLDAARIAKAFDIRVYTVGVGSTGKAKSPVRIRPDGSYIFDWVDVEIDEESLMAIADETGGKYFRATSEAKLRDIYREIDTLEKTKFNVTQYSRKTEEYFRFALFGIFLLLGELVLRNTLLRSIT